LTTSDLTCEGLRHNPILQLLMVLQFSQ